MNKTILTLAFVAFGASAHADGFLCTDAAQNLSIKIYHHTQPQLGTKNAAVMIVSNPSADAGSKTIATFTADTALLTNTASNYTAKVDLRYKGSNNPLAEIAGTTLGNLEQIYLSVDFSFSQPVPAGTQIPAEVVLTMRSDDPALSIPMTCTRYLKN